MIKIGIIGLGYISQECHIPSLEILDNYKILGFTDTNEQVVRQYSSRYQAFETFEDLLDQQQDAVIIATPSNWHSAISIAALQRNIHVLVEFG